jgi:hypothetical protein
MLGCEHGMSGMELVRRSDVDDRNGGVADQHPHVFISPRVVIGGEGLARCRMRIGAGLEDEIRVVCRGMDHHSPRHAEADYP